MNTKMQKTLVDTAITYLSASRVLKVLNIEDDHDTLIPFVGELIDAGFSREEILEAAKRMGQEEGDWIDTIAAPVLYDRPWMHWGRPLN